MRDKYRFPKTLNEQTRVFGLPLEEALTTLPIALIGMATSKPLIFLVIATLVWVSIRHIKKGKGSMWLYNVAYWYLPTTLFRGFFRRLPDSCYRHWLR
jgi:conjugal transfer pilus assembly protein TraL